MSYLQIAVNLDLPSRHIIQNCQAFENSYAVKIFWAVVLIWFGQTFFWDCIRVFFFKYLYLFLGNYDKDELQ